MWPKSPPQFSRATHEQQAKVDWYWGVLNDPNNVLDSQEILQASLSKLKFGEDFSVGDCFTLLNKERFGDLLRTFSAKIFDRGLYALASDQHKRDIYEPALILEKEWARLMAYPLDSGFSERHLLITICSGEIGEEDARQITFACKENDPRTLHVHTYHGRMRDLEFLISDAAEHFENLSEISDVMTPCSMGHIVAIISKPVKPGHGSSSEQPRPPVP